MMEKLLSGDLGTLLLLAGAFILALVGVMSILLPILVFKILSEISDTNKKLSRILTLLSEGGRENRSPSQPQRQSEGSCTTGRAGGLNCEPLKAVENLEPPKGGSLFK